MRKVTEEERTRRKNLLEIIKVHFRKSMEFYLKCNEQTENLLEQLLQEKPVDFQQIKYQIGILTGHMILVENFRLSAEGKMSEGLEYLYDNNNWEKIKKELYEKYIPPQQ
ncbi:MAG: hypothetical protein HWN80_19230 [Candidatus Lokiarchaeota archaeon]|nr:hypothetical protein [Candidatus Lokiarchaeota archaeon]